MSKFTLWSKDLKNALNIASGAIGNDKMLPVLNSYLFEIDGGLKISATNMEVHVSTICQVESKDKLSFIVPSGVLEDVVKSMGNLLLKIEIEKEVMKIHSDVGRYKIGIGNADDYPELPELIGKEIKINGTEFVEAYKKVSIACLRDSINKALTSVCLECDKKGINLVATDGHRLIRKRIEAKGFDKKVLLPKSGFINVLNSMFIGEIGLRVSDDYLYFETEMGTLSVRLSEGNFPPYETIIPPKAENILTVDRNELIGCLKRVKMFTVESVGGILFDLVEERIIAKNIDYNRSAIEDLEFDYFGDVKSVGFNSNYLIEMLNVMDCEKVEFSFMDNIKAVLISGEKYLTVVIMPIKMK